MYMKRKLLKEDKIFFISILNFDNRLICYFSYKKTLVL